MMKHRISRSLSAGLTLCMVLAMLPGTALATNDDEVQVQVEHIYYAAADYNRISAEDIVGAETEIVLLKMGEEDAVQLKLTGPDGAQYKPKTLDGNPYPEKGAPELHPRQDDMADDVIWVTPAMEYTEQYIRVLYFRPLGAPYQVQHNYFTTDGETKSLVGSETTDPVGLLLDESVALDAVENTTYLGATYQLTEAVGGDVFTMTAEEMLKHTNADDAAPYTPTYVLNYNRDLTTDLSIWNYFGAESSAEQLGETKSLLRSDSTITDDFLISQVTQRAETPEGRYVFTDYEVVVISDDSAEEQRGALTEALNLAGVKDVRVHLKYDAYYAVTTSSDANGTISPSIETVKNGTANVTVAANEGYHIATLMVDGVAQTVTETVTFEKIAADHTVAITTAADVTVPGGGGGGDDRPSRPKPDPDPVVTPPAEVIITEEEIPLATAPETAPETVEEVIVEEVIVEEEVPLMALPTVTPDTDGGYLIVDETVPMGALPQTGTMSAGAEGRGILFAAAMALALTAGGLALYFSRKRQTAA